MVHTVDCVVKCERQNGSGCLARPCTCSKISTHLCLQHLAESAFTLLRDQPVLVHLCLGRGSRGASSGSVRRMRLRSCGKEKAGTRQNPETSNVNKQIFGRWRLRSTTSGQQRKRFSCRPTSESPEQKGTLQRRIRIHQQYVGTLYINFNRR